MATIVFMDHDEGAFNPNSLGVLAKAASLGGEVTAFVGGSGIDDAWAAGLGAYGASKVLVADDAALAGLPQPLVDALEPHAREADAVLFGAGVVSADVAAGLAARVGSGINCETTDFTLGDGGAVAVRPALGDTVMVESTFASSPAIILGAGERVCLRADRRRARRAVERVAVTVQDWSSAARMAGREQAETGGVDITEADVLVAFGRGIGGPENIPVVEQLAKALGGEVAATRAVVDAGWTSYSMQVGQTGKTVSPKLYVACGISGAIQHKVGMANAGVIVAINKDVNAPIFEFADLGVVGDVLTVMPKLTEALAAR